MASISDFDVPSDITIFQRPVDTRVDELLIGLRDIFNCARDLVLKSADHTVDFGGLIERSIKHVPERTQSVETAAKILRQLSYHLEESGNHQFTPTSSNREAEANKWLSSMTSAATTFLVGETVAEPINPSEIEIPESIQPLMKERERSIEDLWCYEYACLRIGEKRIFQTEWEDQYNVGDIPALMKKWGYSSVEHPQPGDLVLYLDQESLEPTHLGIFKGNDLVESKWWNSIPVPFLHNIKDAPTAYGNRIIFYRPPASAVSEAPSPASSPDSASVTENDSDGSVSPSTETGTGVPTAFSPIASESEPSPDTISSLH